MLVKSRQLVEPANGMGYRSRRVPVNYLGRGGNQMTTNPAPGPTDNGGSGSEAIRQLYDSLVSGVGAGEPREIARLLGSVDRNNRQQPICRFADAVIARTGDLHAANVAHRCAADALVDEPEALGALMCSWLGVALNLGIVEIIVDIRARAVALLDLVGGAAQAIVETIDAAALWKFGRHAEAELGFVRILSGPVPPQLRGPIAVLRAMSLQTRGLFDASIAVLQADAAYLSSFDLAAEMLRARGTWIAANTPHVSTLRHIDTALELLPDEAAAGAHLRAHLRGLDTLMAELVAVPYVLCPEMRDTVHSMVDEAEPSGAIRAARMVVANRNGQTIPNTPSAWELRNLFHLWRIELLGGCSADEPVLAPVSRAVLRVLGPVGIEREGIITPVQRERVRSLLVALAVHRTISRERLSDLLWPDLPPLSGANNLRTTLSYARRALGPHGDLTIITDATMVSLEGDVDVWQMDDDAGRARRAERESNPLDARAAWIRAGNRIGGRFADDIAESSWVDTARFSIEATQVHVLLRAAESCLTDQPGQARRLAERVLHVDPWNESALTMVAVSWMAVGDRDNALRAVRRAEAVLKQVGGLLGASLGTIAAQLEEPSLTNG